MKYNQPYGVTDPNAGYTNGNPSTGTMGSIPPAPSIEHPQREIVNFISDSGGDPPSAADVRQLSKSVQSGGVNYSDDAGTPNQIVVTLTPPPPVLRKGLHIYTTVAHDNYAGNTTTMKVNSFAPVEIVHLDHTPLRESEMKAGTLGLFVYDGAKFQWVSAPFANVLQGTLTEPRVFYVNVNTGSDTNDGLSLAKPFKTINHACSQCAALNMNGYSITINVADGLYPENVRLFPLSGNGIVILKGNESNPAAVTIRPAAGGNCISWGYVYPTSGWYISGFKVTSTFTDSLGYAGSGIYGGYGAIVLSYMEFGECEYAHLAVVSSCKITMGGPTTTWRITGSAVFHIVIGSMSEVLNYRPHLTIIGNLSFSYFIEATGLAYVGARFSSITISGSVTGTRYYADLNSIITVGGGMGANYLPGNLPGVVLTGGQYIP